MARMKPSGGIAAALTSAVLFGATTPLAARLLQDASPLLVAGLLYLGSGLGLSAMRLVQDGRLRGSGLTRSDWRWLLVATAVGGIAAPAFLMWGLSRSDAATASLLLNLEAVFTAVLAWLAFGEATSRRVVLGFLAIFMASALLAWPSRMVAPSRTAGLLGVVAACLCWGIDNNVTRKISGADARAIAGIKGLVAGITNTALALSLTARIPDALHLAGILTLGFLGYGLSLVLFIVALRHLGTARTSAYFSTGPFFGALLAVAFYAEPVSATFCAAAGLMAIGVCLHVFEHHEHEHAHEAETHTHVHRHDEHHRHEHAQPWDGSEPHSHEHHHEPLRHRHAHFPDIHHTHRH
jgi:drug/metabolite transporter (DMT)-like permease